MKSRVQPPSILAKCRELATVHDLREAGLYPYFMPIEASHDTWVVIDGARKIMVGSNNYMGLTHDPRVLEAAREALNKFGSGNTGSRFLNGNLDLHEQLEAELADFTGMEAALVFSTGYQTNLGTLGALIGRADTVYIDKLDHASLQDGVRLGLGRTRRFNHNDFATLRRMLEAEPASRGKLIAVDGVYSMEGDIADLPTLVELRREYDAAILVADAHAVGVLGETGAGTAEHWGLTDEVDLILGTFSKSFASIGGFVAGRADVIDYLQHNARALMFSASMPPASAATVLKALEIARNEPELRERLWANTRYMHGLLREAEVDVGDSNSQVVSIMIRDDRGIFRIAEDMLHAGVYINPVRYPAVGKHKSRFRMSISAAHTREDLREGAEIITAVLRKHGKCP